MKNNPIVNEISRLMNPEDFPIYNAGLASTFHGPNGSHELTYIVHLTNGGLLINLDYDDQGFSYEFVQTYKNELTSVDLKELDEVNRYFNRIIDKEKMTELFSKLQAIN